MGVIASGHAVGAPAAPVDILGLSNSRTDLALGPAPLARHVQVQRLAPGVTHYKLQVGKTDKTASWYLLGDVVQNDEAQEKLKACFARLSLHEHIAEFRIPGAEQHPYRIVSGGAFASRAAAAKAAESAPGCHLYPRHASEDTTSQSGPWSINIVAIAPGASRGRWLAAANGNGPTLRVRTSELARSANALFAVNGGFFTEKAEDGVPGQAAGVSFLSGQVNGGPVGKRPAVVLSNDPGRPVAIARNFSWQNYLEWADGTRTPIDGINRKAGMLRNCGRNDHAPAVHDYTCKYPDDLVYYPAGSKFASAVRADAHYAIDRDGNVRKLGANETPGATDALLATASDGARAAQIDQEIAHHIKAAFKLETSLLSDFGKDSSVVNAGPTLLLHGEPVREDAQEGWAIDGADDAAHTLLMHDWINRRNPRTAIGIRKDGVILLVVVDGHRHSASVGLTIEELRKLMASLGAVDAVNLDGGGSSAMAIHGRLVNSPSDPDGERKIADAILFTENK